MEKLNEIDMDEYIQNRYKSAIDYYWRASTANKRWYKFTRILTVVFGALVTLIASLTSSTIIEKFGLENIFALGTPILAALLTIIAGFSQSFHWGSTWQNMVLTAQQLQKEYDNYLVTPVNERNFPDEADKLNKFVIIETESFFERMLGAAAPINIEPEANENGNEKNIPSKINK